MREYTYENRQMINDICHALYSHIPSDCRIIYRDAFRWKKLNGEVLSNHYEMFDIKQLAEDFNYEIVHDFNHIAVIRDIKW